MYTDLMIRFQAVFSPLYEDRYRFYEDIEGDKGEDDITFCLDVMHMKTKETSLFSDYLSQRHIIKFMTYLTVTM